ncbi:MAG: 50S ribosomal protein L6 [Bacteroidetes bacterium]|nr:50S ribosomal protein L6 [Bacteroidota bacterium]
MSRIGKQLIKMPEGVELSVSANNEVVVKGPKGTLSQVVDRDMKVNVNNGEIVVERPTEQKRHKAMHGLYRSLINNMVIGVSEGYKKELELVGIGYKAACTENVLELSLGYSHSIVFAVPEEVKVNAITKKGKNPIVTLESIDKQLLGQIAAKIRSFRKVEPYKGKGIRYVGEEVRRKAGKT